MFFPHSARAMISYSSLTFVSLYRIVHVKRAHLGFVQLCLNLTATIPRHQNYWVDSKAIGRWLASRLNNLTSEAWTWRAWRDVNRLLHLRFTSIRSTKDESCIHNGKSEKKFGQEIHLLKFTKTKGYSNRRELAPSVLILSNELDSTSIFNETIFISINLCFLKI